MEKDELNKELTIEVNELHKELNDIQNKINTSHSTEEIDSLIEERADVRMYISDTLKLLNSVRYKQYGE